MTQFISASADIRGDYRYSLTRAWDASLPELTFILLNPSTADDMKLDPTLKRCVGISQFNGFGSMRILNLYAFRATNPEVMKAANDPIGADNDTVLASATGTIVGGWGDHADPARAAMVRAMHPTMKALIINASQQPRHPLYVAKATELIVWP